MSKSPVDIASNCDHIGVASDGSPFERSNMSIEVSAEGSISQRIDFWREMILRLFADVQISAVQKADFFGKVRQRKSDKLRISEIHAAEQAVDRHYRQARSEYEDKYFAVLMLDGNQSVEQDGKIVTLRPGDFAIYDATRPHHLRFDQSWREIVVSIPRMTLNHLVVGMENCTARPMNTSEGVGNVMRTFLEGMSSQISHVSEDEMLKLSDTVITLIAMTLGNLQRNDVAQSRLKAMTLMRAKSFVLEHLQNPELNPLMVEQAMGISSRYLNKLFEVENTSLMRYVWRMRLERCAEELATPHFSFLRVSDVALRWGFNDMSHFSRAFKERFNTSPREWRNNALQKSIP
ncbi:TPA: helix-turn-helix domain-containing protein [Burkholderia cenocepacia]|uniref:helix-turn-helix domain-containing protein n=1 Tax=unclassified Burkholderia TaxID=2613784 RepID=UPI00158A2B0E|nr:MULTISPECIES: helix-turn-helix domain-containing protein [unclassified Burkholderia]HEF5870457.1 helix-turn-helix domain-containing protein [Burkholderia cenocepacia]